MPCTNASWRSCKAPLPPTSRRHARRCPPPCIAADAMSTSAAATPALRDPAWQGRIFTAAAVAVVLWPMLVWTEFKPWQLLAPESLKPTLRFLADFLPPRVDAGFLLMVLRETWRTVAIAT